MMLETAGSRHVLHDAARCWPETNCYVDLWIEVLAALGETPESLFGFTVRQDFEGDQFTFSKPAVEDLRRLYGLAVQELSIYRSLEQHTVFHVERGGVVLLEVDAYYLPDTAATTYRQTHTKTTIAVIAIDGVQRSCSYFHNAARGALYGEDYLGVFRLRPEFGSQPDLLPPYVEIAIRRAGLRDEAPQKVVALDILRGHLTRRPRLNPFSLWRDAFPSHLDEILAAPQLFHDYAFHFPRLTGSNFELLGSHAAWLAADELREVAEAGQGIAQTTKTLQFRLARSVARRRPDLCTDCFDRLEADYERVVAGLDRYVS